MLTGHLRVVLAMEPSLLTSAIQQCLAGNHELEIDVRAPGVHPAGPGQPWTANVVRTVQIGLLEDPVRFALQADGREWILEYQGMDVLVDLLADLDQASGRDIS